MALYIANWSDSETLDAERDDPTLDCVSDLAEPRGVVVTDLDPDTIDKLKAMALEDALSYLDGPNDPKPKGRWRLTRTRSKDDYRQYDWAAKEAPEVCLIVRKAVTP